MDDAELIFRYVAKDDTDAFNEIVRRHVSFVYHVAIRHTAGNSSMAEDASQRVFTDLARKAGHLGGRPLVGWLYISAKFAAANTCRKERRRKRRELEAQKIHDLGTPNMNDADWQRLRPAIDKALDSLPEPDRSAVLLRYFEGRSWGQIGTELSLAEDTVRKRLDRSLERMADLLRRDGIHSTATAIATAMTTQATLAAPSGLAVSLGASAVHSSAVTAAAAGVFSMKATTAALALVALATTAAAIYQSEQAKQAKAIANAMTIERDTLRATARKVEQRAIQAEQDLTALQAAVDAAKPSIQAAATAAAEPNGVFSSFLGKPVQAPANLDPKYLPENLVSAFKDVSKNAGIEVKNVAVDTSEFPYVLYGTIDGQHSYRDIEAALKTLPGYTYGGSVTQGPVFALNMIPMSAVSDDQRDTAQRRLMIRLQMDANQVRR